VSVLVLVYFLTVRCDLMSSFFASCPGAVGTLSAIFVSPLLFQSQAAANSLRWQRIISPAPAPQWTQSVSAQISGNPLTWQGVIPLNQQAQNGLPEPSPEPSETQKGVVVSPPRSGLLVMGMSRGITVKRTFYPDVALTLPNGFKRDPQRFLSLSLEGTNQVRRANFKGCRGDSSCADTEFNAELALLQAGPASLELLYTVADPFPNSSNSNTWRGQALGFRLAVNVSPTVGIAIGGESALDLDGNNCAVDGEGCANLKGRTLYAVASAAIPLSNAAKPPVLTLSAGAGNGYYGFNGNGASDSQWGPFGSISYAFNEYIAIGVEYSGYALSGGFSVKPFKDLPLTGSLYVTDFLGNFPSHIENYCYNGDCSARVLGRMTYSF
jgi:hypothetical protein